MVGGSMAVVPPSCWWQVEEGRSSRWGSDCCRWGLDPESPSVVMPMQKVLPAVHHSMVMLVKAELCRVQGQTVCFMKDL